MRAHNRSWKVIVPALAVAAMLVPAAIVYGHPDQLGTRFVSPTTGDDTGDCDDNHHPCRTLDYALTQVEPGNAIKLAAGNYDVSGIDVENLLIGKEGVRGGYSAEDHFAIQDAETNPTRVSGLADAYRNNFIAHGFTVVDANGDPLPRIIMPKLAAPTACTNGMAGTFPCHNIDYLAQVQLTDIPRRADQRQRNLGPRRSRRRSRVRHPRPSQWHGVLRRDQSGGAGARGQHPGQSVAVARSEGLPGLRRRAGPASRLRLRNHRSAGRRPADLRSHRPAEQRDARQYAHAVQHLAHAVHLEHQLRHQRGIAGATPYLFIAGANIGGGAFRIYDLTNPTSPTLVTPPPAGTGYMHDSTSMLITDNRTTQCANAHNPCQVLVDFNETSVDLWDVTDKAAPVRLSPPPIRPRPTCTRAGRRRTTCSSWSTTSSTNCSAASTPISIRSTSPTCAHQASSPRTSAAAPPPITTATPSAIATTCRITSAAW